MKASISHVTIEYIVTDGPSSEPILVCNTLEEALDACKGNPSAYIRRETIIKTVKDIYPGRIVNCLHDTYGKPRIYQVTPDGELDLLS